jgi:hypothetical protein
MQRNIHDDRTSEQTAAAVPVVVAPVPPPPPKAKTPVDMKKRKSVGTGGLLSCFKSKKPKSETEQQGQPTVVVSQTSTIQEKRKSFEKKPMIDCSILPDGKRIYIDAFRDRPGMDMAYKPENFESRFFLPVVCNNLSCFMFSFHFFSSSPPPPRPNQPRNTNDRLHLKLTHNSFMPNKKFLSLNMNRLFIPNLHHLKSNINLKFI